MPELRTRYLDLTVADINMKGIGREIPHVVFSVEKTLKKHPNTCEVAIWNLNPDHRAALEELRPKKNDARGIPCSIHAGYQNYYGQIFNGDLRSAWSIYEKPNWVTHLSSGDGEKSYRRARIKRSFGRKTSVSTALKAILDELGLGTGNLTKIESELSQLGATSYFEYGKVMSGSCVKHLDDLVRSSGLEWSIQDGTIQFLKQGKPLDGEVIRLSPSTGLIGSPTVDNKGVLTAGMLMIADVRLGGLVVMDASRVKGTHRIEKANWKGDTLAKSDWTISIEGKRA